MQTWSLNIICLLLYYILTKFCKNLTKNQDGFDISSYPKRNYNSKYVTSNTWGDRVSKNSIN